MRLFENRQEAAEELAADLAFLKAEQPVVVALANGGVPLAEVIATALGAPLDLVLIEKLHAPKVPDQAVGAVDEHGRISMIQSTARWHHLTSQKMIAPARELFRTLHDRAARIRAVLPELDVRGRTVILIGQGVATGAKMLGAIASMRDRGAAKVIAAAPAGAEKAIWQLHDAADGVVIPHRPARYQGVGHFYKDFAEVTDELVLAIIHRWAEARVEKPRGVKVLAMNVTGQHQNTLHCQMDLPSDLTRGSGPYPAVIFAHGLESGADSPRSIAVSRRLAKRGIIGVRMEFTGHGRSDGSIDDCTEERMAADLCSVCQQTAMLEEVDPDRLGLVGSGTGATVALAVAARDPVFKALVIRGPICGGEMAAARLVTAPTLLIHAERDTALAEGVETLDRTLTSTHEILRIPESSRLFSDPISLELMVNASVEWLIDHLLRGSGRPEDAGKAVTERPTPG